MDLDLDNDDVGVEAWKDMLGIADEGEREASAAGDEDEGKEDGQEVAEGDDEAAAGKKSETAAAEDSDDLDEVIRDPNRDLDTPSSNRTEPTRSSPPPPSRVPPQILPTAIPTEPNLSIK